VAIRAATAMLLTVLGLPRAAWWIWVMASSVICPELSGQRICG
jgi:hypothetical protein